METFERVMSTTPNRGGMEWGILAACAEACTDCELACVSCADACLGEQYPSALRRCIRLNLDCADICATTARLLVRLFETELSVLVAQLEACARICALCAAECERHGGEHRHCAACADVCRKCERQCREVMRKVPHDGGNGG